MWLYAGGVGGCACVELCTMRGSAFREQIAICTMGEKVGVKS